MPMPRLVAISVLLAAPHTGGERIAKGSPKALGRPPIIVEPLPVGRHGFVTIVQEDVGLF